LKEKRKETKTTENPEGIHGIGYTSLLLVLNDDCSEHFFPDTRA
jgi:hypothetical protein